MKITAELGARQDVERLRIGGWVNVQYGHTMGYVIRKTTTPFVQTRPDHMVMVGEEQTQRSAVAPQENPSARPLETRTKIREPSRSR